jgi:hypothetical protein
LLIADAHPLSGLSRSWVSTVGRKPGRSRHSMTSSRQQLASLKAK